MCLEIVICDLLFVIRTFCGAKLLLFFDICKKKMQNVYVKYFFL